MARHEKDGQDETVLVEILSVHKAIECRERYRKFKRPVAGEGVTIQTAGRTIITCLPHLLVYLQSIIRVAPTARTRTEDMADMVAAMLHQIYVENPEKSQAVAQDMKDSVEARAAQAIVEMLSEQFGID